MASAVRRADLGVWPTPLEPAPRLGARLGLAPGDLWIKRDDWLGLGGGGSKLRKLEFLCGRAIEQGATTLLTSGAAQRNPCRLTAAAARRLGLDVVLVLEGDGPTAAQRTGNLTLDGLFGAEIRWAGDVEGHALGAAVDAVAQELRDAGARPAVLPFGGTDAPAARGYLACATELEEQAPDLEHVVVAVGSGGTMAGLAAAVAAGQIRPGQRTAFVHTGGLPGLFGHPAAAELARRAGGT